MVDDGDLRDCRAMIRRHARSFSFAARFLRRPVRSDVAIVYAYYRMLDDLVDEPSPLLTRDQVRARLDGWERWLLAGSPTPPGHVMARALSGVIERRGIDPGDLREVIGGLRRDLDHTRPATMADLEVYAYQVAGSVGVVMASLLGARPLDEARPAAAALGSAMQLTNVCRDVDEDLALGRIYLPRDVCAAVGCDDDSLRARRPTPGVRAAVRLVAARARDLYGSGVAGLRYLPREVRFPIAVAARAYAAILDRLARRDHDVFAGRVHTTRRARLLLAARVGARLVVRSEVL